MVYCAASQSLACMETLVHLDLRDLPKDYQAIGIDLPDDLPMKVLAEADLPSDWKQVPGPESLKELGEGWLASRAEVVLVVPSAVVPSELNYLINPEHPEAKRLIVLPPEPFPFDSRLAQTPTP